MKRIILMACLSLLINSAVKIKDYDMLTVKRTYEKCGQQIWEIEYENNIYIYTDINLPLDSEVVIADCSESIPYIITP